MSTPLAATTWDPAQYLRFADRRTRPGVELITRIPDIEPSQIVDLGAGTGHLTAMLARRWPTASVTGVDSSPEMIERARTDHPELTWRRTDLTAWYPEEPVDLLFSNATLHWIDDHASLIPRLRALVAPGGVFAFQLPDNWREPSHLAPARILDDGDWPTAISDVLMRDRVAPAADYRRWVQPAEVDVWRTTYWQEMAGDDPIWEWTSGSLLRPVIERLRGTDLTRFRDAVRTAYRTAYPPDENGITLLPFSRTFIIAQTPRPEKSSSN